jgi:hypothetical protein
MILLGKAFTKLPKVLNNLCKRSIRLKNTNYSYVVDVPIMTSGHVGCLVARQKRQIGIDGPIRCYI